MVRQRDPASGRGCLCERWSDFNPSVVESVATAMSPNNHIIPSGSENATQLIPGCLEALSSRGRLLGQLWLTEGGGRSQGSRRPWLRVWGAQSLPLPWNCGGPAVRVAHPPRQDIF